MKDIPNEIRAFHKTFEKLSYYKHDPTEVMDTFLEWVMWGFCPDNSLNWQSGSKFSEDERKVFPELFAEWLNAQNNQVKTDGQWFDLFGSYYETHIAGKSRRNTKGQFFTPPPVCDFMTLSQGTETRTIGQRVSDPTCGSGRLLLAFHAKFPGNYMFAEDIDRTCCLMTVCNFIIHGAVGEVVHHNSLDPYSWFDGWLVNENLNNPLHKHHGIPHVRKLSKNDSHIVKHWEQRAKQVAEQKAFAQMPQAVTVPTEVKPFSQLTLF